LEASLIGDDVHEWLYFVRVKDKVDRPKILALKNPKTLILKNPQKSLKIKNPPKSENFSPQKF